MQVVLGAAVDDVAARVRAVEGEIAVHVDRLDVGDDAGRAIRALRGLVQAAGEEERNE